MYLYPSDDGGLTAAYSDGIIYGIGNGGDVVFQTDVNGYFKEESPFVGDIRFNDGRIVSTFWDVGNVYVIIIDA